MTDNNTDILTNLQKYYAVVRDHAYNLPTERDKALSTLRIKQEAWSNEALQFIYDCYLKDKYFDELDLIADGGEVLTECKLVVNIVFPGYLDNLKQIMQIMLDFDNMLALSPSNYIAWKQRSLHLNDKQKALIARKEQLIINRYKLKLSDVIFYRSQSEKNEKVQRSIDEISRNIENFIKCVQKSMCKSEHAKAVEVFDIHGKLIAIYPSIKDASEGMFILQSRINNIVNRKRSFGPAKSRLDGKRYTFRFVGDNKPLCIDMRRNIFIKPKV